MTNEELFKLYTGAIEAYESDCFGPTDMYIIVGAGQEILRRMEEAGRDSQE